MDYDIKKRIDFHGKAYLRDAAFSVSRLLIVYMVIGYMFWGKIDLFIILLMILYGIITVLGVRKKMRREQKYYTFEPGNPTYDYLCGLSEKNDPEEILNEINRQVKNGEVLYSALAKPNKSTPETLITESWFVHLNKRATVIPLNKIICAYLYDNVTRETPDDKFLPTHFKPIFLIITYGEGMEAIIRYSNIEYKKVLEVLDKKLGCKVFYTRELGTLYKTDYSAFLTKIGEALGNRNKNETPPQNSEGA